jgi:hypothetical protein
MLAPLVTESAIVHDYSCTIYRFDFLRLPTIGPVGGCGGSPRISAEPGSNFASADLSGLRRGACGNLSSAISLRSAATTARSSSASSGFDMVSGSLTIRWSTTASQRGQLMRSIDYDAFEAQVADKWCTWAKENNLSPDRPTEAALRKFFKERWPALATSDGDLWQRVLKVLAEHGYQANVT